MTEFANGFRVRKPATVVAAPPAESITVDTPAAETSVAPVAPTPAEAKEVDQGDCDACNRK